MNRWMTAALLGAALGIAPAAQAEEMWVMPSTVLCDRREAALVHLEAVAAENYERIALMEPYCWGVRRNTRAVVFELDERNGLAMDGILLEVDGRLRRAFAWRGSLWPVDLGEPPVEEEE